MQTFKLEDGTVSFVSSDLPPALPLPQEEPQLPDTTALVEAMKLHGLFRTGPRGLYYNRHLLPEPFNTMGRDKLYALTRTQSASRRPAMRSIQRHIGAAQRMLDDLRRACACPALRAVG